MTPKGDARISAFRAKHERELRKLITIGCCVASSAYEGNTEVEDTEMNAFAAAVIDLVERTRRQRRHVVADVQADNKVVTIRA